MLDEADRMLDMGFSTTSRPSPNGRRKAARPLLFSGHLPEGVKDIAPPSCAARHGQSGRQRERRRSPIRQIAFEVTEAQRLDAVPRLLRPPAGNRTIAFCNTKQQCRDLEAVLAVQGFRRAGPARRPGQRDRDQVLIQFANRSASVLVATDVAARARHRQPGLRDQCRRM